MKYLFLTLIEIIAILKSFPFAATLDSLNE